MLHILISVMLGIVGLESAVTVSAVAGRITAGVPVVWRTWMGVAGAATSLAAETSAQRSDSGSRLRTGVFINEHELTPQQVQAMIAIYRVPPPQGRFWYDPVSGLYGLWGREAAGSIRPGHTFAPLSPRASNGNSGVFVNGRELNAAEVSYLQVLFNGQVRPGRVWLDGRTWNIGLEGSAIPVANLAWAIQQRQNRSAWSRRTGDGGALSSDGHCTMVSVPGAPTYATSGCE